MKVPKTIMGGGAILLAIFIAVTLELNLPNQLHYLWALLSFAWGAITLATE